MTKRKKKKQMAEENDGDSGLLGQWEISPEAKRGILVVTLFVLVALFVLSLLDFAGILGNYIEYGLSLIFGWSRWLFPVAVLLVSYMMLRPNRYTLTTGTYLGLLVVLSGLNGLMHMFFKIEESLSVVSTGQGGGYLGFLVSFPLRSAMGSTAALIVMLASIIIGLLILLNTSLTSLIEARSGGHFLAGFKLWWQDRKYRIGRQEKFVDDNEDNNGDETHEEDGEERATSDEDNYEVDEAAEDNQTLDEELETLVVVKPKKRLPKIDLPLDLLDRGGEKPTSGDIKKNQEIIRQTLENFNIEVEMGEVSVGPTVTQYTFKPAEGVKLARITSLQNDLALALAAHPVRMEAPIPGKSLVGLEVPNQSVATVRLRELLDTKDFKTRGSNLMVPMGKDVSGKPWFADLAGMPHLLVAGATGSGKSVALNSTIISLLYQNNPEDLKFIMVDPKRVELTSYNNLPYLITPVITDVKKTINALKWTIGEMDRRYELLSAVNKRNIASYNASSADKLPYIIFIIDELADLMATSAAEVEAAIIRLAQMARAVGIHLVLATQRPSVDVITGLIKANITSRVAFSVASLTDSRTILDSSGAEKLLGRGDSLFISAQLSKPKRLQGTFLTDDEIKRVTDYIKEKSTGEVEYEEGVTEKPQRGDAGFNLNGDEGDELYSEAREVVIRSGKASASLLQRRLKVGYARAARLLDLLEEAGIVGPAQGAKPREILKTELSDNALDAVAAELSLSDEEDETAGWDVTEEEEEEY